MTLTEAAFWTKRFGVVFIVIFSLFLIGITVVLSSKPDIVEEKYQQGDFACTETKERFAENILTIPSLEILNDTLDVDDATDTGKYDDDIPEYVNVYRYTDLGQKLNAQAEAKILAKLLGFEPNNIIRTASSSNYLWQDRVSGRNLNINARDLNFVFNTDIDVLKEVRSKSDLPTEQNAITLATNALESLGLLKEAYTEIEPLTYPIDINADGSYSEAKSLLEAELIRVDFLRKMPMITLRADTVGIEATKRALERRNMTFEESQMVIDDSNIPVLNVQTLITHQNPLKSNVSVYVGPPNKQIQVLPSIYKIDYTTWTINPISCGTYLLIKPSIAVERIKNGEGSIAFINFADDEVRTYEPQLVKNFIITDLYLTYYEGQTEQNFLQPVYLFEGIAELENGKEGDFHIYYPAIDYDLLEDRKILEEPEVEDSGGSFLF